MSNKELETWNVEGILSVNTPNCKKFNKFKTTECQSLTLTELFFNDKADSENFNFGLKIL